MTASNIKLWPVQFRQTDWPDGVLDKMSADLLFDCIFPLRLISGVQMWPSSLYGAHIRETGKSQHSIEGGRLSTATDMHVATIAKMIAVMIAADSMPEIKGIGVYFDTNTPLVHIDSRKDKLMWLRYTENEQQVYLYRENDPVKFYIKLGELL